MAAGLRKLKRQWTPEERKAANLDQRLKSLIMSVLPDDQMNSVMNCITAKPTWDDLILYHKGTYDVKGSRVIDLELCYNTFNFKEGYQRVASLLPKWLAFCQSLKNTNHLKESELAFLFDSPDDEEDTGSSQEYLNDLKEEYQARALLAKSKSSNALAPSLSSSKNKSLIAKTYDWDEEEVSSDENEATEVKAHMDLDDEDRVSVGTESARNSEWIKISKKNVHTLLEMKDINDRKSFLDYLCIYLNYVEEQRNNLMSKYRNLVQELNICKEWILVLKQAKLDLLTMQHHPLPPVENLTGDEPVSGPKTIKSILKSKSTFKAGTLKGIIINEPSSAPARGNKSSLAFKTYSAPTERISYLTSETRILNRIISLRRGIKPRNPQHVTKNCKTYGSNVHTTSDHNDIEWFKEKDSLQAKKVKSFKATMFSSEAEDVAVAGCCANILWIKIQLTDYDIIYEKVTPPSIDIVRQWFPTTGDGEEVFAKGNLKKSLISPRYIIIKLNKRHREKVVPYTRFLSILMMHKMKKGYRDGELTLYPTQVFSVNNWALKPNQPKESLFTNHMLAIYSVTKLLVFKAPKPSSDAERVSQGTTPGAKPRHKKHSTSLKQPYVSSKEATKGASSKAPTSSRTGHSKKRKESSSAMDSNLSQPLVFTPVNTRMHKEDQQTTGGPTYLGVTSKARVNPQLSSGMLVYNLNKPIYLEYFIIHTKFASRNDASVVSTANVDPGKSAPSILTTGFKDINSPKDDHVIVVDDSDEDEENEGEHIKKDKGKKAISSEEAKKESINIVSNDDDETHVTGYMVESSTTKKLKKFDCITEDGKHIHLTKEQINQQKKIEEKAKAKAAKHEREKPRIKDDDDVLGILSLELRIRIGYRLDDIGYTFKRVRSHLAWPSSHLASLQWASSRPTVHPAAWLAGPPDFGILFSLNTNRKELERVPYIVGKLMKSTL
nr:hypothetical protein [Tanacetum cinerariifolium]